MNDKPSMEEVVALIQRAEARQYEIVRECAGDHTDAANRRFHRAAGKSVALIAVMYAIAGLPGDLEAMADEHE